jgi:hypothetical protein
MDHQAWQAGYAAGLEGKKPFAFLGCTRKCRKNVILMLKVASLNAPLEYVIFNNSQIYRRGR